MTRSTHPPKPGSPFRAFGFYFLLLFVVTLLGTVRAQTGWTLNSSIAFNSGNYIYQENINYYFWNIGARYQADRWFVSASLPFILEQSALLVPQTGGQNFSGGMNSTSPDDTESGIGDIYFYGEYLLVNQRWGFPSLSLIFQVKVPTATQLNLFSSGEWDYGSGLAIRKRFGAYTLFTDVNYLKLGDPQEINYSDPFSFGFGIGRFFKFGKSSLSLYYKSFTRIIEGIEAPRQVSLGYFFYVTQPTMFSIYLVKGLSSGSPDYGFAAGLELKL